MSSNNLAVGLPRCSCCRDYAAARVVGRRAASGSHVIALSMSPRGQSPSQKAGSVMATTVAVQYGTTFSWVGRNLDGRLDVFARNSEGTVKHTWQLNPDNTDWSEWRTLGDSKKGASRVVVAPNRDGRLEVFALFPRGVKGQGNLEHNWQKDPNNEYDWSGWKVLFGAGIGNPSVNQNADGRLEVFVRNPDHSLEHDSQRPNINGWFPPTSLGGYLESNPVAAQNADGRLAVFARDRDQALQHIWQTAANNGWAKSWAKLPGSQKLDGFPVFALNADGRMELFARSTDHVLLHIWQVTANGAWSPAGWQPLGDNIVDEPAVVPNRDGRLEVFAIKDGVLQHIRQTGLRNDLIGWSDWQPLGGGPAGHLAVVRNRHDQIEVFAPFHDGTYRYMWQTVPNDDDEWSEWHSLGSP
ncbi:hypothetical protein [Streptomyces sp. NPDC059881]|uniref:hypothetical protein n=1 Tax=Streptomyces sp. NPDC059881 TaxID=3346986 RepID=UPI0036562A1F